MKLREHVIKAVEHNYENGKVTAIIGEGGIGKSTVMKLLVKKHYSRNNSKNGIAIFIDEPGSLTCMNPTEVDYVENKSNFSYDHFFEDLKIFSKKYNIKSVIITHSPEQMNEVDEIVCLACLKGIKCKHNHKNKINNEVL